MSQPPAERPSTEPRPAGADLLDPDLLHWLLTAPGPAADAGIAERRQILATNQVTIRARLDPLPTPVTEFATFVDGAGGPIPVRVFTPAGGSSPKPIVVYLHGGGWVIGEPDTHLTHARLVCAQGDAVVVSVGYRLGPEHRFPAAFDDSIAATDWAAASAGGLGADPNRLVVAGDSAGGQLAASVAIARRDAGQPLAAQLLLYPVTDVTGNYRDATVNAEYVSRVRYADGPGLTLEGMAFFADNYVDEADSSDWRVSPLRAGDLRGVAPAVVHTAALDVLASEGRRYADALIEAGVPVIAREHEALNHAYFPMGGVSRVAGAAAALAVTDLVEVLRAATT